MTKPHLHHIQNNFIRYANCWEDADVLLKGLDPRPGKKILSVGSAGDNSFSLLVSDPEIVVAADINPVQIFLIELKKLAIQTMEREEFLRFMGFDDSDDRLMQYEGLCGELSHEARAYWDAHRNIIRKGIIFAGKFERYFSFFSGKLLPWVHSGKRINRLFEAKPVSEQQEFYVDQWNNLRWKLLFRIFFSKKIMGNYGRDPEFLREVKLPVGEYIFRKAGKHLSSELSQQNYFLHFILTGKFGKGLPHYVRQENYERIKANIGRLVTFSGYVEETGKYGLFDYMNLSNIFEYMDRDVFASVAGKLGELSAPDGRLAYWNLMVIRQLSEVLPGVFERNGVLSKELSERDKGFFYNQFNLVSRL